MRLKPLFTEKRSEEEVPPCSIRSLVPAVPFVGANISPSVLNTQVWRLHACMRCWALRSASLSFG